MSTYSQRLRLKAFTLVELLIAIAVAALVISGVFMSLINSMVLDSYNQNFTIAMNIARAEMEKIFNNRPEFDDEIISSPDNPLTLATNRLDGNFQVVVTDVIAGELKNIKISVCWKERGGRIIGDCVDSDGNGDLEWKAGLSGSPCSLETSIAKR